MKYWVCRNFFFFFHAPWSQVPLARFPERGWPSLPCCHGPGSAQSGSGQRDIPKSFLSRSQPCPLSVPLGVFQSWFPPCVLEGLRKERGKVSVLGVLRLEGGRKKKNRRHTATERGPRKIFNPNNEHCRFLPQSAFPVNFPGRAGGAKNGRALCLVSVCARKGMCPGDTVPQHHFY